MGCFFLGIENESQHIKIHGEKMRQSDVATACYFLLKRLLQKDNVKRQLQDDLNQGRKSRFEIRVYTNLASEKEILRINRNNLFLKVNPKEHHLLLDPRIFARHFKKKKLMRKFCWSVLKVISNSLWPELGSNELGVIRRDVFG